MASCVPRPATDSRFRAACFAGCLLDRQDRGPRGAGGRDDAGKRGYVGYGLHHASSADSPAGSKEEDSRRRVFSLHELRRVSSKKAAASKLKAKRARRAAAARPSNVITVITSSQQRGWKTRRNRATLKALKLD